jgi:drug/metabolite transporter (DMT)-like permease
MLNRAGALAYAAALASILGWASLYSVAKPALEEVSPVLVATARATIATFVLATLSIMASGGLGAGLKHLREEAMDRWQRTAVVGVVSFTGTSLIAMTAQGLLPASVNGLLNNLSPLWIALFAVAAGRSRNGPLLVLGATIAAAGVGLVLFGRGETDVAVGASTRTVEFALGAALSLSGSLLIAFANVLTRSVMRGRDPLALTAVAAGWGSLPLLALLVLGVGGGVGDLGAISFETRLRLLWLGTASTAFNFALWSYALAHLPVTRVAPFQYLIAPCSVAIAFLLLGETFGPGLLAGTVAIAGGIALAQRGAERM